VKSGIAIYVYRLPLPRNLKLYLLTFADTFQRLVFSDSLSATYY